MTEPLSSGVESRPHCSNWHVHDLGNLFVAQLFHFAKDERRAEFVGQLGEQLFNNDSVLYGPTLMVLDRIEFDELCALQPQPVHTKTHADLIKVAREGAVLSQFVDLSKSLEEGLLSHVFRLMAVAQQVCGRPDKTTSVSGNKHPEGVFIAQPTSSHPLALLSRLVGNRSGNHSIFEHCWNLGHVIVHDGTARRQSSIRNSSGKLGWMPFFWLSDPGLPVRTERIELAQVSVSATQDRLEAVGKVQEIDPVRQIWTYTEGVVARFGPTTVYADRLEIHRAPVDQYGIARGNVRVEDPEGTIRANYLIFWFGPKKGPDGQIAAADQVEIDLATFQGRAESAVIREGLWEFLNVSGTNCRRPLPLYEIKAKRLLIRPGKDGALIEPRLTILGRNIGRFPNRNFSLDQRNEGLQLPSVGYRAGAGLGIAWSSSFLLGDQALIRFDFSVYPRALPSYGVTYSHSFLSAKQSMAKFVSDSELRERFRTSFFDDIRVENPDSAGNNIRKNRNAVTIQSIWNTASSARLDSERFSKAIDLTFDRSGPVGPFGIALQMKGQKIKRDDDEFIDRGLVSLSLQFPKWTLSKGLWTDVRVDSFGKVGGSGTFGWARGQAGLVYEPIPQFRMAGAYVQGLESGQSDYLADRLVSKRALHLRADLSLGGTKLSFLSKFDQDRRTWYDKEWSASQEVGCLEVFMVRREFPRDYVLGVRLRLDDFTSRLKKRKLERTRPVETQAISRTKG